VPLQCSKNGLARYCAEACESENVIFFEKRPPLTRGFLEKWRFFLSKNASRGRTEGVVGLESVLSYSPTGLLNDAVARFAIGCLFYGESKHLKLSFFCKKNPLTRGFLEKWRFFLS
jgi:hypothetical protein